MRDTTVLGVEQYPTALGEGDPALGVEMDTLLVPPVPGAGLPLKAGLPLEAEEYAPQTLKPHLLEAACHALEVEQITDHNPGVGATRNHGVGVTDVHEAGILLVPGEEQDSLDLGVDHRTQCQRAEPGMMNTTIQTMVKCSPGQTLSRLVKPRLLRQPGWWKSPMR